MESLNSNLITQSINYHGQQLQKIWEAERGEQDLLKNNVRDLTYDVYNRRSKHLSFQDRGKRLKLQQFVTKKAPLLFANDYVQQNAAAEEDTVVTEDMYAIMPPLETYLNVDKQSRLKYFFEKVKIGDLILGTIVSKTQSGMMLKVLCTTGLGVSVHYVADINIKAFCPVANVIPAINRKGDSRSYMMNDSVCCEVLEVIPDTDKMVCGMKGTTRQPNDPEHRPPLGLISADDFPLVYKKALDHKNENYETVLQKSIGFNNPNNIVYLSSLMGIDKPCSLMSGLRGKFPENEYASELRQQQASKWAYSNVADGIDHFKAGRHTEAFQCLNKALNIDPKNVEGLVARGALFANSGNFQKAIEDFEAALKLNPSHANARKYMGETLVALGRSYEEENKIDEARKAYLSCLSIIPYHEEAQNSLDFLKNKGTATTKNLIEPTELLLPSLSSQASSKNPEMNDALKSLLKTEEEEKKEKKKKKKGKKRKNRRRSSSSSSSSSSGSNESSSSSSSSTSDSSSSSGDSEFKKRKKHRSRSHRREKQSSLSPLSKRMAMMEPTHDTAASYQFNKPATSSFEFAFEQQQQQQQQQQDSNSAKQQQQHQQEDDYENKVRSFLEQTKGDSDYEDKVRKFLEETAKWKKEKRDDKKKKKKKEKKSKKDSKKKKKKDKLRRKQFDLTEYELRDALKRELGIKDSKRSKKHGITSDDEDYILQKVGCSKRFLDSLPDLDELESKLNAYYAMEKETKRSEMSESPKRSLSMGSPSPTREQKARLAVAEATASANNMQSKWKMQIGAATSGSSRFKKKPEREEWIDERVDIEKRLSKNGDGVEQRKGRGGSVEKNMSVRKAMAMKEQPKKPPEPEPMKKVKPPPPVSTPKPIIPPGPVVLDKFGNFRLMTPPKDTSKMHGDDMPPLPPGGPPKSNFTGRNKPPEPPGRPRSGSRSPRRRATRSRSGSRSTSNSRSRSRSYRSRSRSYYSHSRSRSGSYYSRSRSRSRSYSGDRRRHRRGGFRGRFNDRGTYYKPRFQNPRPPRGRGGYYSRDRYDRDYRGGRGRPYYNRGGRRPRGRYSRGGGGAGFRDYRDRRDYRSRSRDRSRTYSGSRDRDSNDSRRDRREDEKINKYADGEGEPIRHEGPLSEGEDRDDYTANEKFVDREAFDGKWAEDKGDGEEETLEKEVDDDRKEETNED